MSQTGWVPDSDQQSGWVPDEPKQNLKTGAGMLPGEGGPVAKPAIDPVLKAYSDTLNPQERYLDSLPPVQRAAASQRLGAGNNPAPWILAGAGTVSAGSAIAKDGIATAGKALLRTGLKSAAGSEIGGYGGRKLGQAIDGESGGKIGQQIGETGGAIAGPFIDNGVYARMPLGMGRMFLSDADYAGARSASKLAQRTADIEAGLRKPPKEPLPLTLPQNSTLSTVGGPPLPSTLPSPSNLTATGTIEPQFVREIPRARMARPTIAAPGEGPIGSNQTERQIQGLMGKSIVTPEEQSTAERMLGPNARMRPGEGLEQWRARVTGLLKAARARIEP